MKGLKKITIANLNMIDMGKVKGAEITHYTLCYCYTNDTLCKSCGCDESAINNC